MKTTKLMKRALFASILAIFALVGCEELDTYTIDAPADLQSEIDSIAAAKASVDTGDTTYIDIATAAVGAEDYSSAWFTAFSDYFTIPANKKLVLEFVNHNGGSANNWNNWNLAVANVADRDADNYAEYFVLRSDAYGWGNDDFDLGLVSHNYPDTDGDEDIWNDFRATMDGAQVTIEIDHSVTGNAFVTATAVGTNGTELVLTYQQPVSATEDIVAFLISDASYMEMERAYLLPSEITVVEDVQPTSIAIDGTPDFVEIGNEDFWGNGIATVTFADGSSEQVDTADISFSVIPDMTTLGEKTVILAYNKTKQGEYTKAVSTYYTLEVTNSVSSLEITSQPDITTYYYYGSNPIIFDPQGMVVTATYSDGTTSTLEHSALQFSEIQPAAGAQNAVVSYEGAMSTVTADVPLTLIEGVGQVGANDFSTAWWTEFSADYAVPAGESKTFTMYCYSNEANNYNSPSTILRKADLTEYAVVRMDHFGWGTGYDNNPNLAVSSDWNFETFASNLNGSEVVITITNNGDDTADIRYDVTYATGETHFQSYEGIIVDSSDLNTAFVLEGAYIVFTE
ncbi:bacterial Ig-like domain-containing protein [Marinilabilia sp.]|uniref:bacterial Ig-like domain-containing protein n=1 Tax=Marinilabilia sp. TaxID=2021252 RepID=UPI0025C53186|nr:bacterial Ig-like domain-containing protein [Marinilabilia sp.]